MSKSYFVVRCYQYVAFGEEPQQLSTKALLKVRHPSPTEADRKPLSGQFITKLILWGFTPPGKDLSKGEQLLAEL